jgi:hypothetical protein
MAYGNGFYAYVVVFNRLIEVTIEDAITGASIASRVAYAPFVGFSCDYALPVIVGTSLIVVGREHATANIKAAVMDLTNIAAGFGALTLLKNDAKASPGVCFDAAANGAGFTLAYLDNASHLSVKNYTTALVQTATDQEIVAGGAETVSMSIGSGLVAVSFTETGGSAQLLVWTTALVYVTGPTTVVSDLQPRSCACAVLDATHIALVATLWDGNVYTTSGTMTTASVVTAGKPKCYWTYLMSKPWVENGLLYGWLTHVPVNLGSVAGFAVNSLSTAVLVEYAGSSLLAGTQRGFRPVGSDCNRFTGAVQQNQGGAFFPMSVASPQAGVHDVILSFLETPKKGGFARERADFTASNRWAAETMGNLTSLSSGPLCYDGSSLFEIGFLQNQISLAVGTPTGAGTLPVTQYYYYTFCYVIQDASGNIHRSAPGVAVRNVTLTSAGNQTITVTIPATQLTWRMRSNTGATNPQDTFMWIEIYRSTQSPAVANGGQIQTYLLATILNSLTSATVTFTDTGATDDATLSANPTLYTFGGQLAKQAPPSFISIAGHGSRIFGIAPDRRTIYYSSEYVFPEAINFNDQLTLTIDDPVKLVAVASMDDKLVIFSDRRIYFLQGQGPADNGQASDYGLPVRIATDVGCVDRRSIVLTPEGLFFQSAIGIYLLDRGLNLQYIGQSVIDDMTAFPVITAAVLHPTQPWVYFMCTTTATTPTSGSGQRLVYDYRVKKWYRDADFHVGTGSFPVAWVPISAVRTPDNIYWLDAGGRLWLEDASGAVFTDNGKWVTSQAEGHWARIGGPSGYQTTRTMTFLGERLSAHDMNIEWRNGYSNNYDRAALYFDPQIAAQARAPTEQFQVSIEREHQAVSVRITDFPPTGSAIGTGQGCRWYAMTFEADPLDGPFRVDPAQQSG